MLINPVELSAHKLIALILYLVAQLSYLPGNSQEVFLNLEQARNLALELNTEMQKSRLEIRSAQQQIRETTAIGLPQVTASAGYQHYLDLPTSLVPAEFAGGQPGDFIELKFGTEQNLFASASLNQIIFSGEYIVGLRAARIYRELANQNLQRTAAEVINMVSETYLLIQMTESNLSIVRENLVNISQTLFETEKILEAGFTDPIQVDQLKLTVTNMQNRISSLERQADITRRLLMFQIGLDMEQVLILTDTLEDLFSRLSIDLSWDDFDPSLHIDFRLLATQEEFSRMVLRREQSFYLPSLNASFVRQESAMRNEFTFFESGFPWFPTTYFSVNLSIPVFSSGLRSARVQQARIDLERARLDKDQVRQSLIMQMQKARADFATSVDQYQNQQGNLDLAKKILDRTRIMHREGLATSLELTQASDQYLNTQAGYFNAMFEVLNAKNQLEKSMGR